MIPTKNKKKIDYPEDLMFLKEIFKELYKKKKLSILLK